MILELVDCTSLRYTRGTKEGTIADSETTALLDLIYVDVERVELTLAQLLGGVPTSAERTESAGRDRRRRAGLRLHLLEGGLEDATSSAASERVLWEYGRDLLVTLLDELKTLDALTDVTGELDSAPAVMPAPLYEDLLYDELRPGRFFTYTGLVRLLDYQAAIGVLRQAAVIGQQFIGAASGKHRTKQNELQKTVKGMEGLEALFSERLLIRAYPSWDGC